MTHTVIGVFNEREDAEEAIIHLEEDGYNPKDISIVMKDKNEAKDLGESTGVEVTEGAVSGATTGAVVGGITGLLIGIGAIAIPGIGGLLIGGPLAAALGLTGAAATTVSGATTGALAGGLIGALTSLGVSEDDARVYEDRIKAGGILIAVPVTESRMDEVSEIMAEYDAEDIHTVTGNEEHRSHYHGHTHADDTRIHTSGGHRHR